MEQIADHAELKMLKATINRINKRDEQAVEILESCLNDWPHAATMVCSIMSRLEKAYEMMTGNKWKRNW